MKWFVAAVMLLILLSLGSALYHMLGRRGDFEKMTKALTWRIGLSMALFVVLIAMYYLGYIHPHPLGYR